MCSLWGLYSVGGPWLWASHQAMFHVHPNNPEHRNCKQQSTGLTPQFSHTVHSQSHIFSSDALTFIMSIEEKHSSSFTQTLIKITLSQFSLFM